jgi:Zn-dependent protease with chaperone function
MDTFNSLSKFLNLNESQGEFKNIDDYMLKDQRITKRFLFWSWKVTKHFGIDSAKYLEKENERCKKIFKNLTVHIYAIPNKDINCCTIPGYFGDMSKEGLMKPLRDVRLHEDYRSLKMMNFESAKSGPNRSIIFPSNKLRGISIFPSYGLLSLLTPEERTACYLHEIGHWNYLSKMIPRQILMNDEEFSQHAQTEDGSIIPYYNIQLLQRALQIGYQRWNEYESDLYAVRFGYGEELKSLFDKAYIGPPKDVVDAYTYMQHQKFKKVIEYWNSLKNRFNVGHPSDTHRKQQIDYAQKNKDYLK